MCFHATQERGQHHVRKLDFIPSGWEDETIVPSLLTFQDFDGARCQVDCLSPTVLHDEPDIKLS